jgi:soluble lytic murein transglycosylase-like protein
MRTSKLISVSFLGGLLVAGTLNSTGLPPPKTGLTVQTIKQALDTHPVTKPTTLDKQKLAETVYDLHIKYSSLGITAPAILGLIETESTFKATAVGYAGKRPMSYGLTQLTPVAAKTVLGASYSKDALLDPITNVNTGVAYLAAVARRVQQRGTRQQDLLDYALGCYNMGETGFYRNLVEGKPGKTATRYITKQTKYRERWEKLLEQKGGA